MKDLINRQEAIDAVEFGITYAKAFAKETGDVIELFVRENETLREAIKRIEDLPSAEPERKNGKWNPFDVPWYQCSVCGAVREQKAFMENFCPNCGADMRGEQDE